MEAFEHVLVVVGNVAGGLIGGVGGTLGVMKVFRAWYKDKRTADAADTAAAQAKEISDREFAITQLRQSLQNEFDRKLEVQKSLDAAQAEVRKRDEMILDLKDQIRQKETDIIRLKGERGQWQKAV